MAEEIFLNQMSTGAGSDIENATDLARRMVCEYGMSRLGPLTFGKKEEQIFLGREIAQHRDFSKRRRGRSIWKFAASSTKPTSQRTAFSKRTRTRCIALLQPCWSAKPSTRKK